MAGGASHYLDSNVLIYFVEGDALHRERADWWFTRAGLEGQVAATSELALAECLRGARRYPGHPALAAYQHLFNSPGKLHLIPASRAILELSAEIGAATRTKLADSIHLATASVHGCTKFVTNDLGIARAPPGLEIVPFWDALKQLD